MKAKDSKAKSKQSKEKKSESSDAEKPADSMETNLYIAIALLIIIFGFILFGRSLINRGPEIKTIDQLHQENLVGKLKPEEGYIYNGFSFVKAEGMWFTQIHKVNTTDIYNLQFHFGPMEVGNITINGSLKELSEFGTLNGTYVTFDPKGKDLAYVALSSGELSINLASVLGITPIAACTKNETNICHTRPIVTCENNKVNPIIYMEESSKAEIVKTGNCIRIKGSGPDLVRATDGLLLFWFGIIG